MAFESIRNFKSVRNLFESDSMLVMSISDDTALKDGTIPRNVCFIFNEELLNKLSLLDKRVDILIDSEANQGMFKLNSNGLKISAPKKDGVIAGKKGYLRFRLPTYLSTLENTSGHEITIIDFLDDGFVFEFPNIPKKHNDDVLEKKLHNVFSDESSDDLFKLIKENCPELKILSHLSDGICNGKHTVINERDESGDKCSSYGIFSYDQLSMFIHGWMECLYYSDSVARE